MFSRRHGRCSALLINMVGVAPVLHAPTLGIRYRKLHNPPQPLPKLQLTYCFSQNLN
ncbi:hypothetical protein V6Z11_A02G170200 [Gossypium hirsutum]